MLNDLAAFTLVGDVSALWREWLFGFCFGGDREISFVSVSEPEESFALVDDLVRTNGGLMLLCFEVPCVPSANCTDLSEVDFGGLDFDRSPRGVEGAGEFVFAWMVCPETLRG